MRLEASVPAEQLGAAAGRLHRCEFTRQRLPDAQLHRTHRSASIPSADPATRQVRIYVAIPNAGRTLVAGLFAEGRVATESRRALAVPATAVDSAGHAPVGAPAQGRQGRAAWRCSWACATRSPSWWRSPSGLAPGDTVLLGARAGRDAPGTRAVGAAVQEESQR